MKTRKLLLLALAALLLLPLAGCSKDEASFRGTLRIELHNVTYPVTIRIYPMADETSYIREIKAYTWETQIPLNVGNYTISINGKNQGAFQILQERTTLAKINSYGSFEVTYDD